MHNYPESLFEPNDFYVANQPALLETARAIDSLLPPHDAPGTTTVSLDYRDYVVLRNDSLTDTVASEAGESPSATSDQGRLQAIQSNEEAIWLAEGHHTWLDSKLAAMAIRHSAAMEHTLDWTEAQIYADADRGQHDSRTIVIGGYEADLNRVQLHGAPGYESATGYVVSLYSDDATSQGMSLTLVDGKPVNATTSLMPAVGEQDLIGIMEFPNQITEYRALLRGEYRDLEELEVRLTELRDQRLADSSWDTPIEAIDRVINELREASRSAHAMREYQRNLNQVAPDIAVITAIGRLLR